jgi:hypothetical protein
MNFKKIYESCVNPNDYIIHIDLKEIGLIIKASSVEEAIEKANKQAWRIVNTDTCSCMIPKIVRISGPDYKGPYEAPPTKVCIG